MSRVLLLLHPTIVSAQDRVEEAKANLLKELPSDSVITQSIIDTKEYDLPPDTYDRIHYLTSVVESIGTPTIKSFFETLKPNGKVSGDLSTSQDLDIIMEGFLLENNHWLKPAPNFISDTLIELSDSGDIMGDSGLKTYPALTDSQPLESALASNSLTPKVEDFDMAILDESNTGAVNSNDMLTINKDKSAIQMPASASAELNIGAETIAATNVPNPTANKDKLNAPLPPSDPDKLSDVLVSAGVNLKEEEDLLYSTTVAPRNGKQTTTRPVEHIAPFLDPTQLAPFLRKVVNENGIKQIFDHDTEMLQFVSMACENWLSNIVTNSVILSRHRRRVIKPASGRSEISKALKEVATKQKEQEEKRIQKRIALGIDSASDDHQRAGAEETLHRAANATAAMMTSSKKRKYSWMVGGVPGAGSRTNSAIASRGDNGIRYREARQEQGVVLRDLLAALDNEKVGVEKAIVKGYARMKD